MTTTFENIIPARELEDSQTAQYTSTGGKTVIDKFTVTNTGGTDAALSVNLVAAGDLAGSDNLIIDARSIAPGETYECPELIGQVLEDGDYISTLSDTANVLTANAAGRVIA